MHLAIRKKSHAVIFISLLYLKGEESVESTMSISHYLCSSLSEFPYSYSLCMNFVWLSLTFIIDNFSIIL